MSPGAKSKLGKLKLITSAVYLNGSTNLTNNSSTKQNTRGLASPMENKAHYLQSLDSSRLRGGSMMTSPTNGVYQAGPRRKRKAAKGLSSLRSLPTSLNVTRSVANLGDS